jgi:hypothetical protein
VLVRVLVRVVGRVRDSAEDSVEDATAEVDDSMTAADEAGAAELAGAADLAVSYMHLRPRSSQLTRQRQSWKGQPRKKREQH